jgi:hypothetical protein
MFARVVTFAGGDPTRVEEVIAAVRDRFAPEGGEPVSETAAALEEAESFMMLVDRERAHILGITLFEDRDKLRRGMAALDKLPEPAPEAGGRRVRVDVYEVPIHVQSSRGAYERQAAS